jgi:hypothetical protein
VFRQTAIGLTFHALAGTAASLYYLRNREWAYEEALEEEGMLDDEPVGIHRRSKAAHA